LHFLKRRLVEAFPALMELFFRHNSTGF
jgi:hypothetical protein